jgi:TetR/AcrR family transcriptional regulator, repressor for neighboring sulfatase
MAETNDAPNGPAGREEVVEAILKAGRELIAARGPSGVSLREISKHAGVNHGLVYMYVGTKDQLITEVFRRAALEMAERLNNVDDLAEALDLLLHAGDGSDTRLMAWAALDSTEPASLFGPTTSLESLAQIFRGDAADNGTDMPLSEARIAAALAAMVATAWRVFSPVAKLTAGVPSNDTPAFDKATSRLISSLRSGLVGRESPPAPSPRRSTDSSAE